MLRDVFYYGNKPNVHPREKFAASLEDARNQCTTEHFWIINEYCDYRNFDWDFDFEFLPDEDVWAEEHNNVWPSQHQKDSGTWLCSSQLSEVIIYRNDVEPVIRKNIKNEHWASLELIDETQFDFSWHPDPTDPPFIYQFGTQWQKTGGPKYISSGIVKLSNGNYLGPVKYVKDIVVTALPTTDNWIIPNNIDVTSFDFSWHPDDTEDAYIYQFGTQWQTTGGPRYVVEGATSIKYIATTIAKALPDFTNWEYDSTVMDIDSFNFSWHPYAEDEAFIYQFGTQHQKTGGPKYITPGVHKNSAIKYIDIQHIKRLPNKDNFEIVDDAIVIADFDYSWHPDDTDELYIYQFGNNQYPAEEMPTIQYVPKDAVRLASGKAIGQVKYVNDVVATLGENKTNWVIPKNVDTTNFDFSWMPHPHDEPYIYQFGTQWQKTGGPKYIATGIVKLSNGNYLGSIKYVEDFKVKSLEDKTNWIIPDNIDVSSFDFSWHPDDTESAYIYEFGTQWQKSGGPRYVVEGATETKYVDIQKSIATPTTINWEFDPAVMDVNSFDFSWHPYSEDESFVYQFGTQWQKTGGPKYITPGVHKNSAIKYIDIQKIKRLPNKDNFEILDDIVIADFDYSWHPDDTDDPFIYEFGTQWYDRGGPRYIPKTISRLASGKPIGQIKYVNDIIAVLGENKTNWELPDDIDTTDFDFSWVPHPEDPPYIYKFGTQWQKTGGPIYKIDNATEIKYVDTQKVKALPNKNNWVILNNIDASSFDFSWHPDAIDEAFIYQFGTQWQKTGGPRYVVEGATEVKYVDTQRAIILPNKDNFEILADVVIDSFDYSWHPDDTDESYLYVFGNNQYPAEVMPTIQYVPASAVRLASGKAIGQVKYVNDIVATLGENKVRWDIPENIDTTDFDFSWTPHPHEDPYVYQFGTQWQKTGGPRYVVEGATEVKYVDTPKVKALPNNKFVLLDDVYIDSFDYSWHPDDTDEPYIYVFGNNQYPAEIMPTIQYVPDSIPRLASGKPIGQIKYVIDIVATLGENKTNWIVPDNVDVSEFDFSWVPNPKDPAYIYQFGTQWQKTGGPCYVVEGATEVKYVIGSKAKILTNRNNWEIPDNVIDFDFSWHPDATDDPYIYEFGTQWHDRGGPKYVPDTIPKLASGKPIGQIKYINDIVATLAKNKTNWNIPDDIDTTDFDFSWVPHPDESPYIYQFGTQWQKTGGPSYVVDGASEVKYVDLIKAKALANKNNWEIPDNIIDFDYSWHPDATDDPFIYQFGTQWQKTGGPKYIVDGATEVKYVEVNKSKRLPNKRYFNVLDNHVVASFDYSWHPDETDEPYIYVFGNNQYPAEVMPTIRYVPENIPRLASGQPIGQIKYINDIVATLGENKANWNILLDIDDKSFDWSWLPHPHDPPYIYVFGNQWYPAVRMPTVEYVVPEATEKKYIDIFTAKLSQSLTNWVIPENIDTTTFDFSWIPDAYDEAFIYEFGTQHQKTGGPRYVVEGATETKYIDLIKSKRLPSKKYWFNPNQADTSKFDFSWHPDETAPPYIYQFGTLLNKEDGPRYMSPNTNGEIIYLERVETIDEDIPEVENFSKYVITTTLEDLINQHPNELFWALNPDLDYSEFDFDWRPDIEQSQYLHAFGSQDNINTQTYFVNAATWLKGFKEINYVEDKTIDVKINIDMFFVDRSNSESQARFEKLKTKFPNIQKTRYLNSWVDTINRCINRASSNLCWILNSELDYSDFNFNYYPNPWQMKMVHVFGTQWSHWGTTFMVSRETFAQDTKFIKIIEHLSNLNFVKDRKAKATNVLYDIVYVDHGNVDLTKLKQEGKTIIKYQDSYIATFQKLLDMLPVKKEHYIWVASTVCDYKDFDFTYICDPFAKDQLHVFPSDRQKFGDTFLIDVNKLRELIEDMNILEDYVKVNYNQSLRAKRLPAPVIVTEGDTHVSSINTQFDFPYAVFTTSDNKEIAIDDIEPMSLWTPESKNIQITSVGGTRIVVPKEAKDYVKRELYDYPYIITNSRLAKSSPMDIVFLSNGETGAEENYKHLLKVTEGLPNRVTRVDGVNGRVAAYHAAAEASNTAWMFTVFAKLKVSNKFDWNWQPDRLQLPKHYVFHARNPVNGLSYGHMAMIAYNKKLTLANQGKGLDFTMDDEHEVLEINSGIANFNTDEWSTWRTAFREALKLCAENSEISKNRLEMWLTVGMGKFNEYSTDGAQHAVEYFEEVNGDFDKLKLSYDWPWLRAMFDKKYK